MSRIAVIVTFFVAACDVGSVTQGVQGGPDGGNGGRDGQNVGGDGGGSNGCLPVNPNPNTGHHNAGQNCLQQNCHLAGQTGPNANPLSFAGTLYRDAQGASVFPGATIILSINGTDHKLQADSLGNFSIDPTTVPSLGAGQNADSTASGCPTAPVIGHAATGGKTGQLVQGQGGCNNCHNGTTNPVIHLP